MGKRLALMALGFFMAALGIFCISLDGYSFGTMAFPIGVLLMIVGTFQVLTYSSFARSDENKHWVLTEGLTSFVLGVVVISGSLSADVAVLAVFGFWSVITGIRNIVVVIEERISGFEKQWDLWTIGISAVNFIVGMYTFFNQFFFNFSVLGLIGMIFLIQGINVFKSGADFTYKKPDILMTKEELIQAAEEEAKEARAAAKIAIQKAKEAKQTVREVEETKTFSEKINEPIGQDNVPLE